MLKLLLMANAKSCTDVQVTLTFAGGAGALVVVIFAIAKAAAPGEYHYAFLHQSGKFRLAPNVVIQRKTKSNFFGSKSKDVIVYVPRAIKEEDIKSLMGTMLPAFLVKCNELLAIGPA